MMALLTKGLAAIVFWELVTLGVPYADVKSLYACTYLPYPLQVASLSLLCPLSAGVGCPKEDASPGRRCEAESPCQYDNQVEFPFAVFLFAVDVFPCSLRSSCWHHEPSKRPTFEVVEKVSSLLCNPKNTVNSLIPVAVSSLDGWCRSLCAELSAHPTHARPVQHLCRRAIHVGRRWQMRLVKYSSDVISGWQLRTATTASLWGMHKMAS
jgi:hypothetical protein